MNNKILCKFIIIIAFGFNCFSSNAQLILTTASDVYLKENSIEPNKIIKKLPAHKNLEIIEYNATSDITGFFKVKVNGEIGFIDRNDVYYDESFYICLKISTNEKSNSDTSVLVRIYSLNNIKIEEEKIWAIKNGFESEGFSELMKSLYDKLPAKPVVTSNDIINQGNYDKKCIQSEESLAYASSINYTVNTFLDNTVITTLNNEKVSQKDFFNISLSIEIKDHPYGPHYDPMRRTIVMDKGMVGEIAKKSFGNERVKAVMAHEYAHGLQHAYGFYKLFDPGIYPELHADFLAGFYIGRNGLIEKSTLSAFAQEFYGIGDGLPFYDPRHHGTSSERRCAFLEGYKLAVNYDFNIVQAYNVGIDYIKLRNACDPFAIIKEYSKKEFNKSDYTQPTGQYVFSSTEKKLVICNIYGQILGEVAPGVDLKLSNLTPGNYVVVPAKKKIFGRLKFYPSYTFAVKPNHIGGFKINKVGLFRIQTYSMIF